MSKKSWMVVAGGLALIVLGAAGWYLASPLFIDRTVEEELPFELPEPEEMTAMPAGERQELATEVMGTAAAMPEKEMAEGMPAAEEAKVLRAGVFAGADSFHQGSGRATIYQMPDGMRLLRLDDFMVTNGPDLHVLLATGQTPGGPSDLGEYTDLGPLKGNVGSQNYVIPTEVDIETSGSVVIYCVPFKVIFATAPLSPPS